MTIRGGMREGDVVVVSADARACRDGQSPMFFASRNGHSDCVAALVRAGAPAVH